MADTASILADGGSVAHLTREKGFAQLEEAIQAGRLRPDEGSTLIELQNGALAMVTSAQWEQRLGGLRIGKVLTSHNVADGPFMENAIQACIDLLEDREVRVRWAVGDLLRALSERLGIHVWVRTEHAILGSIHKNFVSAP